MPFSFSIMIDDSLEYLKAPWVYSWHFGAFDDSFEYENRIFDNSFEYPKALWADSWLFGVFDNSFEYENRIIDNSFEYPKALWADSWLLGVFDNSFECENRIIDNSFEWLRTLTLWSILMTLLIIKSLFGVFDKYMKYKNTCETSNNEFIWIVVSP